MLNLHCLLLDGCRERQITSLENNVIKIDWKVTPEFHDEPKMLQKKWKVSGVYSILFIFRSKRQAQGIIRKLKLVLVRRWLSVVVSYALSFG